MNVSMLIFPLGIHREPAPLDSLFLFDKLQDAPQTWASKDSEDRTENHALHAKAYHYEDDACEQKGPPAARSEIIFTFYYYRVEYSDYKKSHYCYEDACKIHICSLKWADKFRNKILNIQYPCFSIYINSKEPAD